MLPGLIPKALRTTTWTEVKKAHQMKVSKDAFHPSGGVGLLATPALTTVPLLHRCCSQGHQGKGRPRFGDQGTRQPLPLCPSHMCNDPHLGQRCPLAVPGSGCRAQPLLA